MNKEDTGTLGIFTGDQVRKMLAEHPELPVVFRICTDALCGEWSYEFMSSARAEISEILDCYQDVEETLIYVDRDDFETDIRNNLSPTLTDEEIEMEVTSTLEEYEPFWKKCILVTIGN